MIAHRLPLLGWLFTIVWLGTVALPANGQPITPAQDGTNTLVTPNGNRYDNFRDEITTRSKINSTSYLTSAQTLHKWLITPLEKDLERLGIHTLLLSVDPGL